MAKNINHLCHIKSCDLNNGLPKQPLSNVINYGEIAINYYNGKETMFIKNNNDDIVSFSSDSHFTEKKLGSAFTASATVTDVINEKQDKLVSGSNIKTINGETVLGNGNLEISGIGEMNTIEKINVNGSEAVPDSNKTVNIQVPTTVSQLSDASDYTLNSNFQTLSSSVNTHIASSQIHLPNVSNSDNGKVLVVRNGQFVLETPSIIYTGQDTPNNSIGNDGDLYLQTSS